MLMRPEAAFPYVFAAEGAQHPPKKPPRSTPCRKDLAGAGTRLFLGIEQIGTAEILEGLDIRLPAGLDIR